MGGGDLNMKKSWHPQLLVNQERVWLKEKEALEEKKKLDQLRKEREEERQVQELQRLQEEKTGKRRVEKLDWLYATPASGSGPSAGELEEYLLGKKRVDKILIADENAKIGAAHKNFIAVQNANTVRDMAAKVREDPLFAIMQQQQANIQALKDNPLRLKELQAKTGGKHKDKKDKKDKKGKHRHDYDEEDGRSDKHRRRRDDHSDHRRRRSRSTSPSTDRHSRRSYRSRSRSPMPHRRRESGSPPNPRRSSSRSLHESRRRSPEPYRHPARASERHIRPRASPPRRGYGDKDREARLAAMTQDASAMEVDRAERLAVLSVQENEQLQKEEAERRRNAKDGIQGGFLSSQQKRAMDTDLGEKLRQGRRGLIQQRE